MILRRSLRPHQEGMMLHGARSQHPAYFVEMRLGKTLVAIRLCLKIDPWNKARGLRVLVIAPNSALGSWEDELAREGEPCVRIRPGRESAEAWARAALPRFFLANKEAHLRAGALMAAQAWDAVILDESTFIKNPRAAVTKHFLQNYRAAQRRIILTGTPAPEGAHEYWCQMAFLGGAWLGFRSFWQFRAAMMRPHPLGFGWEMKPGGDTAVSRAVARDAYVLRRKDVGLKENKVRETRWVEMPPAIARAYRTLEREFVLDLGGGGSKTVWAGAQWQMLRQLAGGTVGGKFAWPGKIDVLLELLQGELSGERVVVWFSYNAEIRAAHEALLREKGKPRSRGWWAIDGSVPPAQREGRVQCFRNSKAGLLLVQQAVAQTGMNLSAADTAIYFSEPVSAFARQQTEDRILSVEKAQAGTPLLYVFLRTRGTVDEDVAEMMDEKAARTEAEARRILYLKMKERSGR